ncbi:putative neprosin [Helianthus debilis subsp. tardiflorus]
MARSKEPRSGDWWLQLGDEQIGYWPSSLFSYLSASASQIQWGGEVVNSRSNGHHTTTEMGSGRFSEQGLSKASYIRNIETVDESNHLRTPNNIYTNADENSCYDILAGIDGNWGSYVYFGGPGRNINCP